MVKIGAKVKPTTKVMDKVDILPSNKTIAKVITIEERDNNPEITNYINDAHAGKEDGKERKNKRLDDLESKMETLLTMVNKQTITIADDHALFIQIQSLFDRIVQWEAFWNNKRTTGETIANFLEEIAGITKLKISNEAQIKMNKFRGKKNGK
jgi:hypothetical protein